MVIRDVLRKAGKVGHGKMAKRCKDQMCAVRACGDGIVREALRYESEVKDSDELFSSIGKARVDKAMLDRISGLTECKMAQFRPEKFTLHYLGALTDLIDEKRKKDKITAASDGELEGGRGSSVIDLMDALRKSIAMRGGGPAEHKAAAPSSRRKSATRQKAAKKKVPPNARRDSWPTT